VGTLRHFISVGSAAMLVALAWSVGCSGTSGGNGFPGGGGGGASSGGASGGGNGSSSGQLGGGSGGGSGGTTVACPAGLQCNVSCSGGGTTTISGKVYDPAQKNALYNVAVYVPATPLQPLPKGVPTGADACSCSALFKSGAVVSTTTGVDGAFKLTNAPVGNNVPLVMQIGKWRRIVHINVTACQDNAQPDKSLALPGTIAAGDTDDDMPDIAVSTGSADTLECLMIRIGVPASEYVAGAGGSGHVHIFAGGDPNGGGGFGGGGRVGHPESPGMPGAPPSDTSLWDSQAHLMPYDITLLSCEGAETYDAKPDVLEQYLNAGGRAFASHFHYSWFSGPIQSAGSNTYSAPADWGSNLATWGQGGGGGFSNGPIGGVIDQTLNGGNQPFAKGQALYQWLGLNNALGQNGVPAHELSIYQPRYDAVVGSGNKPSQPWITSDTGNHTMYFSFDTPVNAPPAPDGGAPNYCGRAVFSDLHVAGNPSTNDNPPPPGGCSTGDLSPQEKALEFMLFDLSSCVVPDSTPPPQGVPQ